MRYRLRTLLIVLAVGSMVLAAAWYVATAMPAHSYSKGVFAIPIVLWLLIGFWPRIIGKGS